MFSNILFFLKLHIFIALIKNENEPWLYWYVIKNSIDEGILRAPN